MNTTVIHLETVFTQGTFGAVHVGMTIEEVTGILGNPSHTFDSILGPDDEYNVKFLRYGGYEFWFTRYYDQSGEYTLSAFQVRDYRYINGYEGEFKNGIELNTWIFQFGATMEDLELALQERGISYKKSTEHDFTVLTLANFSKIYFIQSDTSDQLLCEGWTYHPKID